MKQTSRVDATAVDDDGIPSGPALESTQQLVLAAVDGVEGKLDALLVPLQVLDNVVHAEDEASVDGHFGIPTLAVRKATPANTSSNDGDYEFLQMSAGRLWVDGSGVTLTVANAGTFAVQVDGAALTSLQLIDDTVATTGSAITAKGIAAAGTDGTNARILKTDASGELQIDVLTMPSVAVTNAGTFVVQENGAALTALQLIDDIVTAQGTSLGSTKTALMGGSVTTAAPSYSTGQISPLSLGTDGALRVNATTVASHAVTNAGTFVVQENGAALTALQLIDDTIVTPGTTDPGKISLIGGKTNDGTPQYRAIPEGTGGRSIIIEGFSGGTAVPVSLSTIAVTNIGTFVVQENGAALTSLQLIDDGVATVGSAITTKGMAAIGTDGTNARILKTDTSGELQVDVLTVPTITVNSHAVTNAGTFAVQVDGAALTALQLIDDPVATLGTTTYTEASTKAIIIGGVRRDADTTLVDTTNEIAPFQINSVGQLKVEIFDGGESHTVDNNGTFVVQENGAALTALQLIDDTVTAQGTALGSTKTSLMGGSVTTAAPTYTTGQINPLSLGTDGALRVNATTVASHAVTNAGTFAVQIDGAALTSLQLIDDAVATTGSAITTKGIAASGTDGTNARILKTDTSGELQIDVLTMPSTAVTNAGTFVVQENGAALTALQLIDNIVSGSGVNISAWNGVAPDAAAALADNMTNTPVVPKVAAYMVGLDASGGSNADRATLATLFDTRTDGSVESTLGVILRTPGASGSVEAGTATTPFYISGALSSGAWTLAEDAAHASGDLGIQALFVRNNQASVTTFAGANGDYSPAAVEGDGTLWVGGNRAHDTVDAGNPEKIGGKALTSRPTAVAASDRVNAWFDEFGKLVVVNDWFTRSDTFTATGNGTTVDMTRNPVKNFSLLVKMSGTVTSWDVRLEGSNDGTNFTTILTHTNGTPGDGLMQFSGAAQSPVLYFRARCAGLVLGLGTSVTATILGIN